MATGKDIRLYAVSTRYPAGLLSATGAREVVSGAYEIQVLSREVRVIVTFALNNYRWHMEDGSTLINQLLEKYFWEGVDMPYTMEQFRKDYIKAHLTELDPEELLSRFKPEDRLKGLKAEERLKGLKIEEVESYLKKLRNRN